MFLSVAQKALDLGCTIVKEDYDAGKVIESNDIGLITPNKKSGVRYYFHLPEAGSIKICNINGKERLDDTCNSATGNAVIEADIRNSLTYGQAPGLRITVSNTNINIKNI